MIPYSRPKLSDLYTLSQRKLLKSYNLHNGTYLYSPYLAVPPGPALGTPLFQRLPEISKDYLKAFSEGFGLFLSLHELCIRKTLMQRHVLLRNTIKIVDDVAVTLSTTVYFGLVFKQLMDVKLYER